MANLQLKSVSKLYPSGALALYKASLNLSDSEFVAVIGGEKSGKSTLLRVVAGLEEATEGEILIGGKDVTKTPSRDRDVAMIFQGNTLYPTLNVFDNMAYGLQLRKVSKNVIEQRVKAAAELLNLTEVLYRKPKALTTEQKQRTCFGRAIVREPKLYLLDDPIAGVSAELRAKLRSVLINLQMRMKGTFIYATKNVNEALTMATRIIVMREGFIQQVDTPQNLYEYPINTYVAFLVGSPTVNFINDATVVKEGEEVFAVCGDIKLALPQNIVKRFTNFEEYVSSGKKVIVGIRPEDMRAGAEGFMEATVSTATEISGNGYADCDGEKLSFVVMSNGLKKGDKTFVSADLTHAFIFDSETRLTLLSRDEGYVKTSYADAEAPALPYAEEEEIKNKLKLKPADKKKKR